MHTHQAWDIKNSLSVKKSPVPAWVPFEPGQSPPPTSPSRKDGKTNDYNRLFAFFLDPEEHKEQGLWQAPLFGRSASKKTAPAG